MAHDRGPPGAGGRRGYAERDRIHRQLECGVVETNVLMSLRMLVTAVSAELDARLLGNVAAGSVLIQIATRLIVAGAGTDAPGRSGVFMGCVDTLSQFLHYHFPDPPMTHHPGEVQPPSISEDLN
ncbi:hypothetical protein D5086_003133 [Populus alba]|uniref:Uncharacterized protein n=2 Tax=Populus alba TaxID=43335 RepID=A0ACC4D3G7_POPAL|nr:hypothetical protein D5086_0000120420 [Populus alba]